MAIDPNSDLFKALLAMDSYNRGYNARIDFNVYDSQGNVIQRSDTPGTMLGSAEIIATSDILGPGDDQAIGFYAIAYKLPNNSVVVSYRGTDEDIIPTADDVIHGYGVGIGNPYVDQGEMAFEFYEELVDQATTDQLPGFYGDLYTAPVSFTGHSMGGGFAGLLATTYGQDAIVFDSMAFELASEVWALSNPSLLDDSGVETYGIQDEALDLLQFTSVEPDVELDLGSGVDKDILGLTAAGVPDAYDLHNAATMVIRMFASEQTYGLNWDTSAEYFWPVLYDDSFAQWIELDNVAGTYADEGSYATVLRTLIAYSAIDNGADTTTARPFGDTGIRALYNDANDLGTALEAQNTEIESYARAFSEVFVEYAAKLAYNKILQSSTYATNQNALEGVLERSGNVLRADFSDAKWDPINIEPYPIHSRSVLMDSLQNIPLHLLYEKEHVKEIAVAVSDADGVYSAPTGTADDITIFVGANGDDTAVGSIGQEYFYGGNGDDVLAGGTADDVLHAGRGDDVLHGGFDKDDLDTAHPGWNSTGQFSALADIAYAGDGTDTADYSSLLGVTLDVQMAGTSGTVTKTDTQTQTQWTDHLFSIERIVGTNGADIFGGASGSLSIDAPEYDGGEGSDTVLIDVSSDVGNIKVMDSGEHGFDTIKFINAGNILISYTPNTSTEYSKIGFSLVPAQPEDPVVQYLSVEFDTSQQSTIENVELNGNIVRASQLQSLISSGAWSTGDPVDMSEVYDAVYNGGTGGTGAGGGIIAETDTGGNLTSLRVRPDVTGRFMDYRYADENLHPWIITNYTGGGGSCTMTFDTYLQSIDMVSGISSSDVRFTVDNSLGNAALTIHIDALGESHTIQNYEAGKTLSGVATYGGAVHGWVQSLSGSLLESNGGQGKYKGTYTEEYTLPSGLVEVTYFLESMRFANDPSINLQGAMTFTGTNGNEFLYGLNTRGDTLLGLAGSDNLYSYGGNDTLVGGAGSDAMSGGAGDDLYIFEAGFGVYTGSLSTADVVNENLNEGTDTIHFAGGITADEVYGWTNTSGDVYLQLAGSTADTIYISGYGSDTDVIERIERITFDDETVWDWSQGLILNDSDEGHYMYASDSSDVLNGNGGADTINAFAGNDTINGGAGSDSMSGGAGDDLYIFEAGFGAYTGPLYTADVVNENLNEGTDTIHFAGGITAEDVYGWTNTSGDVYLQLAGSTTDTIYISGYGSDTDVIDRIERITFDDETVWDWSQGLILNDSDEGHYMYASDSSDVLNGNGGADIINAFAGNDTINGGAGSDNMSGGAGDDLYIFETGFGAYTGPLYTADVISENLNEGTDTIHFAGGITADDVYGWTNTSGDVYLQLAGSTADTIYISGYGSDTDVVERIERITFDDETVWDWSQGLILNDSDEGHYMYASDSGDVLNGNGGADIINAFAGNDTINGGAGRDTMAGGAGDDLYIFEAGFGVYAGSLSTADIVDENLSEGTDTIHFGGGITADDLYAWADASGDMYMQLVSSAADTLAIVGSSSSAGVNTGSLVEYITFDDETTWNLTEGLYLRNNDTGREMYGSTGNDLIKGGAANDTLRGFGGDDWLAGHGGADALWGYDGSDTFAFMAEDVGNGIDTLRDFDMTEDDVIDLRDVLDGGYDPITDALADFVQFTNSGSHAALSVDLDGAGTTYGWTQIATVYDHNNLDADVLATNGYLLAA